MQKASLSSRSSPGPATGQVTEALPLDGRTFIVDASDPGNPTLTFGELDATGRPRVLYLMLWGLPRLPDDAVAEVGHAGALDDQDRSPELHRGRPEIGE